jgi:hypothetical protein
MSNRGKWRNVVKYRGAALFILPIRDGNGCLPRSSINPFSVFILPIRDGNARLWNCSLLVFSLFILPIRDGNARHIGAGEAQVSPFYTSYKGWKQEQGPKPPPLDLSFLYFL